MKRIAATFFAILFGVFSASADTVGAVPDTATLRRPFGQWDMEAFVSPPRIHYPETWFHFLNGNIDRAGVTKDLEAIAGAGITGISFFHGQRGSNTDWPGTKEHTECLSPQWESLLTHTASEAKRLGLRFSMQTCPGWAMSGGPWVKPEQSMRHLVNSRTDVSGGQSLRLQLPKPASEAWQDYRDLYVLAFPTPLGDTGKPVTIKSLQADTESGKWLQCLNATLQGAFFLAPAPEGKPHTIELQLNGRQTLRSIVFNPIDNFNHEFGVDPGIHVRLTAFLPEGGEQVVLDNDFPMANWQDSEFTMTFALDESTADRYRLEIANKHPMSVSSVRLLGAARRNNWEAEAGWTSRAAVRRGEHPQQSTAAYVQRASVIDLSGHLDSQGVLTWDAPQGNWTVLRIGHVNTGQRNGPAPQVATGWEVNKFDRSCIDYQFDSYIGRLADGALKGLVDNMLMDSWECRTQTWTQGMDGIFRQQRGYDLPTWLPALFGYVLDDPETSAEFLCDWRQTLNRLFVDNFYGGMAENARSKGMTIQYETAAGDIFPADPMEFYKWADVPMTEFWQPFGHFLANHNYKPIRATASAARMYGKPRVSAEAFTSFDLNWDEHLSLLREVANQNILEGVSHMVFHTYTHNPDADRYFPGTSFGDAIGTPFLRKQTWWPYMPLFTRYLARMSYMLERGKPVSDVLWFIGDEASQKPDQYASFPEGYRYDYCNTDALLNRLDVCDGLWQTPEGITYRVLWIPDGTERMLPATLQRLTELVRKGGVLVGSAPAFPATRAISQTAFQHMTDGLWKGDTGAGKVLDTTLDEALRQLDIAPDVLPTEAQWLHRQTEGADWYMICAPQGGTFSGDISFRQQGRVEIWDPVTGRRMQHAATTDAARSTVHLSMVRGQSLLVMFVHDGKKSAKPAVCERTEVAQSEQPWTLSFPEGWGIEAPVVTDKLVPWKDLDVSAEGKAFSGTVCYTTTLRLPRVSKKARYELELGRVEEIAVVKVNGTVVDTLWTPPYTADLTGHLRKGDNLLQVEVTSTWRNRLAYDAALPEKERRTWTLAGPKAGSPLVDYGLLGPVRLMEVGKK